MSYPAVADEESALSPSPEASAQASSELYRVLRSPDGGLQVELTDAGALERLQAALPAVEDSAQAGSDIFFRAEQRADGTYSISLTEDGVQRLETALGIASDFGRHRTISDRSTIADIMERTATREELSEALRLDDRGRTHRARTVVLRRKLRGSEEPSLEQRTVSHIGKLVMVAVVGLWALRQLGIAIGDIQAIPGILANMPNDILHLDPTGAFTQVGNNIGDAGNHLILTGVGLVAAYVLAKLIRPLERIYRRDQLVPGERLALRFLTWILRRTVGNRRNARVPAIRLRS